MAYDSRPGELTSQKVTKVIDMKLPLTWLLSVAGLILSGGFGLYFQIMGQSETLKAVKDDLKDVKISVQSGNQATATVQGELAILKFRIENLEADRRAAGGSGR